jgi:sugar lactone lactonase YvrE
MSKGIQHSTARMQRRRSMVVVGFFVVSLLAICGLTLFLLRNALQGPRREPKAVLEGATVHVLAELPGDRAYPAALAIGPDGNVYVGSFCTGDIWQITPEGELEPWFDGANGIGAVSGMAFGPDGSLYVIDREDCDPRKSGGQIKRISPDGQTVEGIGKLGRDEVPYKVTLDSDGALYFTDSQRGEVLRRMPGGEYETWWELPGSGGDPRPTGLAYDPATDDMIVADTAAGAIYRLDFSPERTPVLLARLYAQDDRDLDGLTVDDLGRVIFTILDTNKVARLEPDGTLTVLAEDFRQPSDVGYLNGAVYVTNFDSFSLAPLVGLLIDPSLPFTVDVIELPAE